MLQQAAQKTTLKPKTINRGTVRLCEKIHAGMNPPDFYAYYLEYLIFNMPEERLVPVLEWLIRQGKTGIFFKEFVETQCNKSGLELIRHVTRGIEKDRELRPIYGKDLRA